LTNQWNALALAGDERIVHVLRPRTTSARTLRAGDVYAAPSPTGRAGVDAPLTVDAWMTLLGAAPTGMRLRAFVARVAYASPLNAPFVIGAADAHDDALDAAHARYLALVAGPRRPCVLPAPNAGQPYGALLDADAHTFASLVDALAAAAGPLSLATDDAARAIALDHAALQAKRATGKARRLRSQLEAAPAEAAALRRSADLLLAQLQRVPHGAAQVVLDDFEGGSLSVELDATRSPAENASQLYAQAKKRDRAAARLPALIAQAERDVAHWQALRARLQSDDASAADIAAAQPAPAQGSRLARRQVPLPYRVYRTTSGLEVRVGRGAKGNDALTMRHAHGNDIWLHARDVGGAHVILRWSDKEANPPHNDVMEAATLAALHSKARTSKLVPVDYTRRKYVRKPRKAPPGRVTFERGKTVFVEPNSDLEERMRVEF
ncbi:MAG: NFACT RNA binding domain-containing protein, partial [Longimicrobiales bacterium]